MKAATLFSGIGAPEIAMPQWTWIWHAEIEPFPSAVMAVRHPHSVNLGDVTAHDFVDRALAIGRPDVLVFGSPCQSYSVAGQRLGLDDPRGNLAIIALGIVERVRPTWFVFENVPGLLSNWSGAAEGPDGADEWEGIESHDFDSFLAQVRDVGYQSAWTVLDAQYAGLAQRRERVFVVGHAQDWRRAAAVLLEPESLCGDSPTRGEAGKDVTGTLSSRPTAGGGLGTDFDLGGGLVAPPISAPLIAVCDPNQVTSKANRSQPRPGLSHPLPAQANAPIAYALGSHAGCADGDQTNRSHAAGGPVGMGISEEQAHTVRASRPQAIAFGVKDYGADAGDISPTLRAGGHDKSHANGGVMPAVAFGFSNTAGDTNQAFEEEQAPPITTRNGDPGMVLSVALRGRDGGGTAELGGEVATAIRASQGGGDKPHALNRYGVRRLMPVECERLQGFPDDYTLIAYRGKPAADGPRYKAIGNSMAVPVIRWILQRIDLLEKLLPETRVA